MKYQLSALLVLIGVLTGVPPETNKHPEAIKLQSTTPEPVKQHNIAIILRNVYIFSINNQQLLVVSDHYLHDLTNIYKTYQVIPKIGLDEP